MSTKHFYKPPFSNTQFLCMKKRILFSAILFVVFSAGKLTAQSPIGITVISDETSGTDRAFALADFITQKKYTNTVGVLEPRLVDYVYGTTYGLSGKLTKMMASLVLYKDAKTVAQVTCENKWELISAALDAEFVKLGFTSANTKIKIDEGDEIKVYEKRMADNLPGAMSFELPKNIHSDEFKINAAEVEYFVPKDVKKDLQVLHGKYGSADITDSKFFKSKDIPKELKDAIEPLASPIGKTMLMPSMYISYGNLLFEQKDYETAQHCYMQAIAGSYELIGSSKDKANIRAYVFAKLATLQTGLSPNRVLMAKLYNACAAINKSAKLSDVINKENADYYGNVKTVQELCIKAEQNAKSARSSRFTAAFGAVSSGLGQGFMSTGGAQYASLASSVQMMQVTMEKSQEQLIENMRFKDELRSVSMDIKSDAFITDAGGVDNRNYFLAGEVYYFLTQYPDDVKDVLEEYAADKPALTKLLADYYGATTKPVKNKAIKELYKHLGKIEYTISNFEARSMVVPEKYIADF